MDLDDFYDMDKVAPAFKAFLEFCALCEKVPPTSRWHTFAADAMSRIIPPLHTAISSAMARIGYDSIEEGHNAPADPLSKESFQFHKAALVSSHQCVFEAFRLRNVKLETIESSSPSILEITFYILINVSF
jgi:hypothetical protein